MRGRFQTAMLLAALVVTPVTADAGWVSEWTNTLVKSNGERVDPQPSILTVDQGRVRTQQPELITVIDYNAGRMTMINPAKQWYWSGTVDDYVREIVLNRGRHMRDALANSGMTNKNRKAPDESSYKAPTVDTASLPPVSIMKTALTDRIVGYDTVKYEVRVDGELFQELWLAPGLNLTKDLDPTRFLAVQQKMSASMVGKSASQFNALYHDPEYRKVLDSGTILKLVTHHIGGQFERVATGIRQSDVPANEFAVPSTYQRVKLTEVISQAPQGS